MQILDHLSTISMLFFFYNNNLVNSCYEHYGIILHIVILQSDEWMGFTFVFSFLQSSELDYSIQLFKVYIL
jgi:hypothetical protein